MKNYEIRSSFTTWLWRIIKNEFINYIRDPETKIEMISDSEDDTGIVLRSEECSESEMIREDVRNEVHQLINALPVKLKMAIVLIDIQEMPYEEAAQILEISLTAMKSRVFKGRKRMAEIMNEKKDIKQLSSTGLRQNGVTGGSQ
jgi:RNA polymerase sigma-70 factor (ECF subfamily)